MLPKETEKKKGKRVKDRQTPALGKETSQEPKKTSPETPDPLGKRAIILLGLFHLATLIFGVCLLIVIWPERRSRSSSDVIEARIDTITYKKDTIINEINYLRIIMNISKEMISEPVSSKEDSITKDSLVKDNLIKQIQIDSLKLEEDRLDDSLAVLNAELYSGDPGYNWRELFGWQLNQELTFIFIVLLSGILGSLIASVHSFVNRLRGGSLERKYVGGYLLRPVFGAALALVFFFVIHGDLLTKSVREKLIAPYGVAGFSALVGMFARKAMAKLKEVLDLLFQPKPKE